MAKDLGYGRRISGEEYDRRIVALHEGRAPMPSREEDREIRRAELDCAIDHRLGPDFPEEKREALWRILESVEKRRLRLAARHLAFRIFRPRAPGASGPARAANALAGAMVEEFSRVLDDGELEAFFELGGEPPALPIDREGGKG